MSLIVEGEPKLAANLCSFPKESTRLEEQAEGCKIGHLIRAVPSAGMNLPEIQIC